MVALAPAQSTVPHDRGRLPPGWPLAGLLVLYPIWWALGLGPFILVLAAVPMTWQMWKNSWIRLPPGFALWGLFLIWVLVSGVALDAVPPDTLPQTGIGRYVAYGMRLATYVAITVIMMYAGNLPRRLVSTERITKWLSVLFLWTVAGGALGMIFPNASFDSPMKFLLPSTLVDNDFVAGLLTPSFAQVQDIVGGALPRPSAPFDYTNYWGSNYSFLVVWFIVGWWVYGTTTQRRWVPLVIAAGTIPLVYSLNRSVWVGLILAALFVAIRLAISGRWRVPVVGMAMAIILAPVALASPLGDLVSERIDNPHSNDLRGALASQSLNVARSSPIVGYGSTRKTIGSERSLTIGQTPECPQCGNRVLGSTGQFWLVVVSQGFVGAAFFTSFFLYALWRYRRDTSAVGIAGSAVLLMTLFFIFFYTTVGTPLALSLISLSLMWRNEGGGPASNPTVLASTDDSH